MKRNKKIFIVLVILVILVLSVIPSFAYYDVPDDTDIKIGGIWYLPESWSFTNSYELRFTFYSSQSGNDDVLDIHYTGIYIDSDEQTIEYITTWVDGTDIHHLVYNNGSWLGDGYRQILLVDLIVDTTDPDQIYYLEFVEYLRDDALDLTVFNYDMAKEFAYQRGHDEGYNEGYDDGRAVGGFTQDDVDNAYNSGYSSGYDDGVEQGYSIGLDDGEQIGYQLGYDDALRDVGLEEVRQEWWDEGYDFGYNRGVADGSSWTFSLENAIDSVFEGVAVLLIKTLSWEILGINVLGTMMAILLVSILAWVVSKVL